MPVTIQMLSHCLGRFSSSASLPVYLLGLHPWVCQKCRITVDCQRGGRETARLRVLSVAFIHSFVQPIFTAHQLCTSHCVTGRGYSNAHDTYGPCCHAPAFWKGGTWVLKCRVRTRKENIFSVTG